MMSRIRYAFLLLCSLLAFDVKAKDFVIDGHVYSKDAVFQFIPVNIPIADINISSLYGMRYHPILGYNKKHEGVDFYAPRGTSVRTTAIGIVVFAGRKGAYGNMIEINHGFGYTTRYAHLDKIYVSVGERVGLKQTIGTVGATGRVTGPHLHYEIRHNKKSYDPVLFIIRAYEAYKHLD